MANSYNKYYLTENLFGQPFPELIEFFTNHPTKGKVLDMGCGQGRDAIPIARLGYDVVGVDYSKVGIEQMLKIAESENLNLKGKVESMYAYKDFEGFDFVLFNSMFHFLKKDLDKETGLIKTTIEHIKPDGIIIFSIQDTGKKVKILNETIDYNGKLERLTDIDIKYIFEDQESGHKSSTDYRMIIIKK